ncbi:ankyrin repeat-containing domain protein [Baffinella frigidus]|nr:ankyrin repeat-containing domain protein [Cryptophyta sp. CCMP2293]
MPKISGYGMQFEWGLNATEEEKTNYFRTYGYHMRNLFKLKQPYINHCDAIREAVLSDRVDVLANVMSMIHTEFPNPDDDTIEKIRGDYTTTALIIAAKHSNVGILEILLKPENQKYGGFIRETCDQRRNTALTYLINRNYVEGVKMLLSYATEDDDMYNIHGNYHDCDYLLDAIDSGHTEIVKLLVNNGAPLNPEDPSDVDYWTPLAKACETGNFECVKFLLEKGATPTVTRFSPSTCSEAAVRGEYMGLNYINNGPFNTVRILELLIEYGEDLELIYNGVDLTEIAKKVLFDWVDTANEVFMRWGGQRSPTIEFLELIKHEVDTVSMRYSREGITECGEMFVRGIIPRHTNNTVGHTNHVTAPNNVLSRELCKIILREAMLVGNHTAVSQQALRNLYSSESALF